MIRTERIEVRDASGQVRTYASLSEVPTEIRDKIEQTRREGARDPRAMKITVTDPSGSPRTYESVDAMPTEIRRLYERARAERTT